MFEHSKNAHFEQQTLREVLLEHVIEQRRARRWNLFFKLVILSFAMILLIGIFNKDLPQAAITKQVHTALIDITGEIGTEEAANADNIRDALKAAFENKLVKGVILRINSPGGSPVQARQVYSEIRALRNKYPNIKLYAAIEDMGTSAAYLIACAADAIYADKASLVGSIGVKIDGFGYVEAMHKIGVERRLYVAGKYKGILDPFTPQMPEENQCVNEQINTIHAAFIENVKEGRGTRLRENPDLFTGLFWSGERALALGLTDGYGDAQFIAKEIIKVENLVDYTPNINLFDRIANRIGALMASNMSLKNILTQKGVR
jgi:protease-4